MDTLLIYAFDEQGFHDGKKYIKNDPVSLAKAIMYYGSKAARLTITDIWDMPVCTTIGFFLDEWRGYGVSYEMSSLTAPTVYTVGFRIRRRRIPSIKMVDKRKHDFT